MEKEIITLYGEDNEPVGFHVLHSLIMDNHEYLLVQEVENSHSDALILKREGNALTGIQEHEEYIIIKDLFIGKYDELDTEDEIPL